MFLPNDSLKLSLKSEVILRVEFKPRVLKAGRKGEKKKACINFQIFSKYLDGRQFAAKILRNVFFSTSGILY